MGGGGEGEGANRGGIQKIVNTWAIIQIFFRFNDCAIEVIIILRLLLLLVIVSLFHKRSFT